MCSTPRLAALLLIVMTLTACALTQPAKLSDDAFRWSTKTVPGTPESIYLVLQDRFRQCTDWAANCFLTTDKSSASCDVSRRDHISWTLIPAGTVRVTANTDSEVLVRAGSIIPRNTPKDTPYYWTRRTQWLALATGEPCP